MVEMKNFIMSFFEKKQVVTIKLKAWQKLDDKRKNFLTIGKQIDTINVRKEAGYRVFLLIEGEKCG